MLIDSNCRWGRIVPKQNNAYLTINHPDDDALNQQRPLLQGDHDDETLEAPYVRSSALILVAFCFESFTSIITVVWFWRSVCEAFVQDRFPFVELRGSSFAHACSCRKAFTKFSQNVSR